MQNTSPTINLTCHARVAAALSHSIAIERIRVLDREADGVQPPHPLLVGRQRPAKRNGAHLKILFLACLPPTSHAKH